MNRAEKGVIIGTVVVVLVVLVLEAVAPREPNWRPTYSAYKRDPFGCELVRDRLVDLFPQGVTTVHDPIYNTAQERLALPADAPPVNHVFIDDRFDVDALDLENLLAMVARGDNAFIAGSWIDDVTDTLHVRVSYHWQMPDSAVAQQGLTAFMHGDTSSLRFTCYPLSKQGEHLFRRGGLDNMFEAFPIERPTGKAGNAQVLAVNRFNDPVLLRVPYGQGAFYLCTAPEAFSNYYLLNERSRGFMEGAFALMPDRPVLWDEFYKVGRMESPTPFRFVLSKPALKAAYWSLIALLLLYVFVYAKRRQRAIPELVPLKNTSKEFADTIGRLYFFKGDHADLSRKMVLYFKDELRHRLYLRRAVWDAETMQHVSERTGIPLSEWQHAFRLMDHYEKETYVSEEQLIQLNKTLSGLRSRI
ncbi:MAG TPA: DUF4350 domain-containing protein [Flavobacteriales bacterium]|jgi:hypothetical protein|nr:DUF4350 domain-containing protein [Flavobacteriales bacterium]